MTAGCDAPRRATVCVGETCLTEDTDPVAFGSVALSEDGRSFAEPPIAVGA